MMVNAGFEFPDPETADKQGLLAIGGSLSADWLLKAYSKGIFPWFEPGRPILWWSPNPRLILRPELFHLSKSLKKNLKKPYQLSIDQAFPRVINACATASQREGNTWISQEMIEAYTELHRQGIAHSFEVWQDEKLVGGLYGLSMGLAFFGESMFHFKTDCSKIAFFFLCQVMLNLNIELIDCQLDNPHLIRLGAELISRKAFLYELQQCLDEPSINGDWNRFTAQACQNINAMVFEQIIPF